LQKLSRADEQEILSVLGRLFELFHARFLSNRSEFTLSTKYFGLCFRIIIPGKSLSEKMRYFNILGELPMQYSTFIPHIKLQTVVECYWSVEGSDVLTQKIIPDGFTEIVFHFGDAYSVSSEGTTASMQPYFIIAGQLTKPIFLTPSGRSDVFGIKFKPTGIWKLFACDMTPLTNHTGDLRSVLGEEVSTLWERIALEKSDPEKIGIIENYLLEKATASGKTDQLDAIVEAIQECHGQLNVGELASKYNMSTRTMERVFQERIGLSAKQFARLNRFTHVFKLLQQPELTKAEATYLSGYFDQAHFNKEFREFAGENPEAYFKKNHAFSNFFLNR
jgi:AraC-like DNA-binding protein